MNRHEFSLYYAKKNKVSQAKAKIICESVFDLLSEVIVEEDRVCIAGLGTFKKKVRKPGKIGNIHSNGETVDVPEFTKLVFEPTVGIKDAIRNNH